MNDNCNYAANDIVIQFCKTLFIANSQAMMGLYLFLNIIVFSNVNV